MSCDEFRRKVAEWSGVEIVVGALRVDLPQAGTEKRGSGFIDLQRPQTVSYWRRGKVPPCLLLTARHLIHLYREYFDFDRTYINFENGNQIDVFYTIIIARFVYFQGIRDWNKHI